MLPGASSIFVCYLSYILYIVIDGRTDHTLLLGMNM